MHDISTDTGIAVGSGIGIVIGTCTGDGDSGSDDWMGFAVVVMVVRVRGVVMGA